MAVGVIPGSELISFTEDHSYPRVESSIPGESKAARALPRPAETVAVSGRRFPTVTTNGNQAVLGQKADRRWVLARDQVMDSAA